MQKLAAEKFAKTFEAIHKIPKDELKILMDQNKVHNKEL
jgi:hypothetical protein